MAENTEVKKEETTTMPSPEQSPEQANVTEEAVKVPENAEEKESLLHFLKRMLEKLLDGLNARAAYSRKEINDLKKATKNIQRALENGEYSNSETAELAAIVHGAKKAMEADRPLECKECISMAENLVLDKQMENMLKSGDLRLIENNMGIDLVFNPAATKDEMGLVAIKDGKVEGWWKDIEQFKQEQQDPNLVISSDNFKEVKAEDVREIVVTAWESKKEELHKVSEERLFQTELNSKVSPEYLASVVEMIQNSETFDKENMSIIANPETSTILIEDTYKEVNPEKLLFVLSKDGDREGISSIRMVNESFDGHDFDKESMLKESSALIYSGKVSMLDHDSGQWTFGESFVMNSELDGVALGIAQELAQNMDMDIVDTVKEQIQDIKNDIEETRAAELSKEQEDLTKF